MDGCQNQKPFYFTGHIHYYAFCLGAGKYMTLAKLEIYLFTHVLFELVSFRIGSDRHGYLKLMKIYSMAAHTPSKPLDLRPPLISRQVGAALVLFPIG